MFSVAMNTLALDPRLLEKMVQLPALAPPSDARFSLDELSGRLVELRQGGAALTYAIGLVHHVQQRGELAAYVGSRRHGFYPPDVAAGGIDLDALPVVHAEDPATRARAADELLRSGAFALVVVDLLGDAARLAPAILSRLHALVQKHHSAVLFLTEESAGTLGSLVSLRAVARRVATPDPTTCRIELDVVKDKRRAAGWSDAAVRRLPPGLR